MAQLSALETIRALQTLSEVLRYYERQQNGLGARFLRSYDEQIERLRDICLKLEESVEFLELVN